MSLTLKRCIGQISNWWERVFYVFKILSTILDRFFGQVGRVFANGPEDLGSIPGRVMPKTFKMVLDTSWLNTQHYKVLSRVKWSNPGKGVAPFPTPRCSSDWKGSLRVTLDYGCQLYLLYFGYSCAIQVWRKILSFCQCRNLVTFLLRCGTRSYESGVAGLQVLLANHYTTRGALLLSVYLWVLRYQIQKNSALTAERVRIL